MASYIARRKFLATLGGAGAAWICVRSRYAEPRRWRAAFRSSRMASLSGPSASPAQPRFRMAKSPRPVPTWRSNRRASSAVGERASVRSLGDRSFQKMKVRKCP